MNRLTDRYLARLVSDYRGSPTVCSSGVLPFDTGVRLKGWCGQSWQSSSVILETASCEYLFSIGSHRGCLLFDNKQNLMDGESCHIALHHITRRQAGRQARISTNWSGLAFLSSLQSLFPACPQSSLVARRDRLLAEKPRA